jgi:hypothetical protein
MEPGKFRHYDHKFEWTREEFQDWCNNICVRFPDYCVQYHGIGKAPEGHEHLGSCSQLGLFIRKDFLQTLDASEGDVEITENRADVEAFKLIHSVSYPFFCDTRSRQEKILEECQYHINRFRWMEDRYFNCETGRIEIPMKHVSSACWELTDDTNEVHPIILNNFKTENDLVILSGNESGSEDEI